MIHWSDFLKAEQEAQARSHAVRLVELQESCHKKVNQLQQLHREQLSAAQSTSAAALAAAAAPAASTVVTGTKAEETVVRCEQKIFLLVSRPRACCCSAVQHAFLKTLTLALKSEQSCMVLFVAAAASRCCNTLLERPCLACRGDQIFDRSL